MPIEYRLNLKMYKFVLPKIMLSLNSNSIGLNWILRFALSSYCIYKFALLIISLFALLIICFCVFLILLSY
jgi:hypothetical protein